MGVCQLRSPMLPPRSGACQPRAARLGRRAAARPAQLCWLAAVLTLLPLLRVLGPQVMKSPPASYFIKKAAGITAGSQKPGHQSVAAISLKHLHAIAEVKQRDTPHIPLPSIVKALMVCELWDQAGLGLSSVCASLQWAVLLLAASFGALAPVWGGCDGLPAGSPIRPSNSLRCLLQGTCKSMGVKVVSRPDEA